LPALRILLSAPTLLILLCLGSLSCSEEPGPLMPEAAPVLASPSEPATAPAEPEEEPAEPGVQLSPPPPLSPFTPELVANLQRIRQQSDRRQDDVFMKVGDSSTVSRGFLECFSQPDQVDLGGRDDLEETAALFRRRHAGGRDSYRRTSRAAAEGWSARQVLDGNPPPLLAEVRAIRPRFAFVMNGGNDVEGHDPYRYAQRMLRIVELLEENGVIALMNSIPPRSDDAEMNRWVERYNQISWAIARARRLPYLDYHQVMMGLPRLGLAGDGVHPNIYALENRGRACILDEAGLQHGHNARNLLALQGLDQLRRTVLEEAPPPAPPGPNLEGDGTVAAPYEVRELPFAHISDTTTDGSQTIDGYACGEQDESGREIVFRLVVTEPLAISVLAVGRGDADVDVHLLEGEASGAACRERADRGIETTLSPGTWFVSVDTFSSDGVAHGGETLVLFTADSEP